MLNSLTPSTPRQPLCLPGFATAHIYQTRGGLRPDWTTRPSNRIGVPSTDGRRLGRYGHIAADEYASVRRGAKWLDLRSARSCGGGVGN